MGKKDNEILKQINNTEMNDKTKESIKKIVEKGDPSNDDIISTYSLINSDNIINSNSKHYFFKFLQNNYFEVVTKSFNPNMNLEQLENETRMFLKISEVSQLSAFIRLKYIVDKKLYKQKGYGSVKKYLEDNFAVSRQYAYKWFAIINTFGVSMLRQLDGGLSKLLPVITLLNDKYLSENNSDEIPQKLKELIIKYFVQQVKEEKSAREIIIKIDILKYYIDKFKGEQKDIKLLENINLESIINNYYDYRKNNDNFDLKLVDEELNKKSVYEDISNYIPMDQNKIEKFKKIEDKIKNELKKIGATNGQDEVIEVVKNNQAMENVEIKSAFYKDLKEFVFYQGVLPSSNEDIELGNKIIYRLIRFLGVENISQEIKDLLIM